MWCQIVVFYYNEDTDIDLQDKSDLSIPQKASKVKDEFVGIQNLWEKISNILPTKDPGDSTFTFFNKFTLDAYSPTNAVCMTVVIIRPPLISEKELVELENKDGGEKDQRLKDQGGTGWINLKGSCHKDQGPGRKTKIQARKTKAKAPTKQARRIQERVENMEGCWQGNEIIYIIISFMCSFLWLFLRSFYDAMNILCILFMDWLLWYRPSASSHKGLPRA